MQEQFFGGSAAMATTYREISYTIHYSNNILNIFFFTYDYILWLCLKFWKHFLGLNCWVLHWHLILLTLSTQGDTDDTDTKKEEEEKKKQEQELKEFERMMGGRKKKPRKARCEIVEETFFQRNKILILSVIIGLLALVAGAAFVFTGSESGSEWSVSRIYIFHFY